MREPHVTVVMPVRAPAPFLEQALQSVRDQSYSNWTLLVAIDGPDAGISDMMGRMFSGRSAVALKVETYTGISSALNQAIVQVESDYIARLDADDVCHPLRLQSQVSYLEDYPDCVAVGTSCQVINAASEVVGNLQLETGHDVRKAMLRRNHIMHPSVMFRRNAAVSTGLYNSECKQLEDYDLWLRMGVLGELAVLPDSLLSYRVSGGQLSRSPSSSVGKWHLLASRIGLARAVKAPVVPVVVNHSLWSIVQPLVSRAEIGRLRKYR